MGLRWYGLTLCALSRNSLSPLILSWKKNNTQTNDLITDDGHCRCISSDSGSESQHVPPLHCPPSIHLRLDVLLRGGDQAGAAQPQHDHDGQEEAGGQNPPREAGAPAEVRREQVSLEFEAFKCIRLTWTCSPGSRAQPQRPLRAGRHACPSRLLYLPLCLRDPSHL